MNLSNAVLEAVLAPNLEFDITVNSLLFKAYVSYALFSELFYQITVILTFDLS